MDGLRFDVKVNGRTDLQADAQCGDTVFEVLFEPRSIHSLLSTYLRLAKVAETSGLRRVVLILDEPVVSEDRILEEWDALSRVLRPQIWEQMLLGIWRKDRIDVRVGHWQQLAPELVKDVVEHVRAKASKKSRRAPDAFLEIVRVLLIHWFRRSGPLTSKQVCDETGFSYPTVSGALEQVERNLIRHSDRRFELNSFPRDAWLKLVSQSQKVRSTVRLADRSGRPRSPEALLSRVQGLGRTDVAVGGVLGARHYVPGLDLMGTPRVDLLIHDDPKQPGTQPNINALIHKVDPALKRAEPGEPCRLAIHVLYRPTTFFVEANAGLQWADEVECLLDLHDARLESQAEEFLSRLTPPK
jgi:hypothetical protein